MTNPYYSAPDVPIDFTRARGAPIRAQFAAIANAFGLIPTPNQLATKSDYAVAGGTANAITTSLPVVLTAYADGMSLSLRVQSSNTGPATVSVNGLGAVPIVSATGGALVGGELIAGTVMPMIYAGSAFRLPLPGPKGDKGDKGDTSGIVGPQGPPGPAGATSGVVGPQGPQGVPGPTGPQGPPGPAGTNGTNGATGATGSQGPAGVSPSTADMALTGNGTINGQQIGYRDLPIAGSFPGSRAFQDTDRGTALIYTGGAGNSLVLPANAASPIGVGGIITVYNNGTAPVAIARATGVALKLAGTGADADRVLATGGVCWIHKIGTNTWFIGGVGVT